MGFRPKNRVLDNFHMSGMTDIVFLLLIFFMLTSTLIAPNALKMLLPSRGQPDMVEENRVIPTVIIHSNTRIEVDGRTIPFEGLASLLESKLANQSEPTIKVVTSPQVSVGDAVRIMNVAAERNYTVVLKQL